MTFYTFDLQALAQEVSSSCLPCATNREAFKNHAELGPRKSLLVARPHFCYQVDTAYMPQSRGYNYLWIMVCEFSLYTVLFPLKYLSVDAVCECIDTFLTLMPKFCILKSDYEAENSRKLTQHLAQYGILHWNSIPARSAQQGLVERQIQSVQTLINKFVADQDTMDRSEWVKLLPWIGCCVNSMETHASGLKRFQLLFSPFIAEYAVAWGYFDFGIQQQVYKKVMQDRQKILDRRKKLHVNTSF